MSDLVGEGGDLWRAGLLPRLKLRDATTEDCTTIFEWANDPEVRASSLSCGLNEERK